MMLWLMPCCMLRYMLLCVWVRMTMLDMALIGLRRKTQWLEANPRVGQLRVPNTFPKPYLNFEIILW